MGRCGSGRTLALLLLNSGWNQRTSACRSNLAISKSNVSHDLGVRNRSSVKALTLGFRAYSTAYWNQFCQKSLVPVERYVHVDVCLLCVRMTWVSKGLKGSHVTNKKFVRKSFWAYVENC